MKPLFVARPRLIGHKLRGLAAKKRRSTSEIASMAKLHVQQVDRTFDSLGSVGVMLDVANALGVRVEVRGWRLPLKKRALDVASEARVAEPTARSVVAALNSFSTVPHGLLLESLEAVLFTVPGAEFVLIAAGGSEIR